jgi:hypothetical protein
MVTPGQYQCRESRDSAICDESSDPRMALVASVIEG